MRDPCSCNCKIDAKVAIASRAFFSSPRNLLECYKGEVIPESIKKLLIRHEIFILILVFIIDLINDMLGVFIDMELCDSPFNSHFNPII